MVPIVRINSPDGAQRDLFDQWAQMYVLAGREHFGEDHSQWSADQLRELFRSPERLRLAWAAVDDGQVVGAVQLVLLLRDNPRLAMVNLAVDPQHRRQGLGSALLALGEQEALRHGRSVFMAETQWARNESDESGEGFAATKGYAAAQTMVRSTLSLPADAAVLEQWSAWDPAERYVLRTCWDGIPDGWLTGRAELSRRMSTDAPLGDLQLEEERWDEQRVREEYERIAAMGRRFVETFAVDESDGRLVGHTHVQVSADAPRVAYQHDTLVLREHRGHRLGLRLKAANTLALMQVSPGTEVVRTWNAEENRHMLAVNEQLGYLRDGFLREWQKVV
ncbi:MAG TPA: GNAT family N-acetyltransferase [Pedococcus sp.]|jgi:GNAT superfamily N-acetyltransferase|nr:GNAT family N-acetyltransferase [Pedococcus sp.]